MRHHLDGNAIAADSHYGRQEIGTEEGQTCGRYAEPDEDAPRGYRPKQCKGVMIEMGYLSDEWIECNRCGEKA